MHVFLPEVLDTAYIKDMEEEQLLALCDFLNDVMKASREQVVTLRWTKRQFPSRKGEYLYVTKVWVTPSGVRKYRLQCHRIHANGRLGSRNVIEERHAGRSVR